MKLPDAGKDAEQPPPQLDQFLIDFWVKVVQHFWGKKKNLSVFLKVKYELNL